MRWIVERLDDLYPDQGTAALRRIVLALFLGALSGFLCFLRGQSRWHLAPKQLLVGSVAMGLLAMLVSALLTLSSALWSRGWIAKIFAVLSFLLGCMAIIGLLGATVCIVAER